MGAFVVWLISCNVLQCPFAELSCGDDGEFWSRVIKHLLWRESISSVVSDDEKDSVVGAEAWMWMGQGLAHPGMTKKLEESKCSRMVAGNQVVVKCLPARNPPTNKSRQNRHGTFWSNGGHCHRRPVKI